MEEKIDSIVARVVDSFKHNKDVSIQNGASGVSIRQERVKEDIESLWCRIVNDDIRAHSYVEHLRQNTLFVRVDSSCYLSTLKMQSNNILAKLNRAGRKDIKKIRFRL